jgi:hypothetical protein
MKCETIFPHCLCWMIHETAASLLLNSFFLIVVGYLALWYIFFLCLNVLHCHLYTFDASVKSHASTNSC